MSVLRSALLDLLAEIETAGYGTGELAPRYAKVDLLRLGWLLQGKRVPTAARQHPLVQAVVGWRRRLERGLDHDLLAAGLAVPERVRRIDDAVMRGFLATLPALRTVLEDLMPDTDLNRLPPGVLGLEHRGGGQVIASVSLPAASMAELVEMMSLINHPRPVPSLESVGAAIAQVADQLTAEGVRAVWMYGSVARGRAHGGSDVDLIVELVDESRSYLSAAVVQRLLEDRLERLVDLLLGDAAVAEAKGAVLVWEVTP